MKHILVIGATSAIAEATARRWVERGDRVFLVGRNAAKLQAVAADLTVRGGAEIGSATLDVDDFSRHEAVIGQAVAQLGQLDTVLIAHGTLPDQAACDASVPDALREINTNALSVVSLMSLIARRFRLQGRGDIAVISSVAGDRGRASNFVYGSAKALVSTYASGLRQQLGPHGVNVLTIKPGFVDTPMTQSFRKGALWAQPASVARDIVKAIDRRQSVLYTPWFWWLVMSIIKSIPESIFRRLKL